MSSITYRIATGAQAGRKVVTLQTLPGDAGPLEGDAGKVGGFSLHAGVAAEAHESEKLEKLCGYITRPAISEKRLSISPQGRVRYQLKTPWRNGTTHVEWDPVDFIAKRRRMWTPTIRRAGKARAALSPRRTMGVQDIGVQDITLEPDDQSEIRVGGDARQASGVFTQPRPEADTRARYPPLPIRTSCRRRAAFPRLSYSRNRVTLTIPAAASTRRMESGAHAAETAAQHPVPSGGQSRKVRSRR